MGERAVHGALPEQCIGHTVGGKWVFRGVSPLRFDTKALHEVVYKTFRDKPKCTLYMERLCARLCTELCTKFCTELCTELYMELLSTDKIRPIWLRQEDRSFWANWGSTAL
jgi:hypothetical protein